MRLEIGDAKVRLTLTDDGCGFPFNGNLNDRALRRRRMGPVSLKQRVHANGGRMSIHVGEDGAQLAIEPPRSPRERV